METAYYIHETLQIYVQVLDIVYHVNSQQTLVLASETIDEIYTKVVPVLLLVF